MYYYDKVVPQTEHVVLIIRVDPYLNAFNKNYKVINYLSIQNKELKLVSIIIRVIKNP